MSTDDLLRDRLRSAADAAGAHANPADALRLVNQGPPPPTAGPKLWLVSVVAVVALAAGTLAGATVLSPGAEADPLAGGNGGGGDATALPASPTGGPALMAGTVYDCPGGAEVGKLRAGDRVYVVGRDESGSWAAIRDPQRIADVAWVEQSLLVPDGDIDVETMRCTEPTALVTPNASTTTTTAAPEAPSTTIAQTPQPGNSPTITRPSGSTTPSTTTTTTTAAPDTQVPTIQVSRSRDTIYLDNGYCNGLEASQLTVLASDNVGVTSVTATYPWLPNTPLTFTRTGGSATNGTWTATFGPFTYPTARTVPITVAARDGSGNSAVETVTITYTAMGCLY